MSKTVSKNKFGFFLNTQIKFTYCYRVLALSRIALEVHLASSCHCQDVVPPSMPKINVILVKLIICCIYQLVTTVLNFVDGSRNLTGLYLYCDVI